MAYSRNRMTKRTQPFSNPELFTFAHDVQRDQENEVVVVVVGLLNPQPVTLPI